MSCDPPAVQRGSRLIWERPGPWSARRPGLACRLAVADGGRTIPSTLVVTPLVGTASEELFVQARGADDQGLRWSVRRLLPVVNGVALSFQLPAPPVQTVELQIVPVNLPFVKLTRFELGFVASEAR
jgi:hypothetical protein